VDDHLIMAVASYASRGAAEDDFVDVCNWRAAQPGQVTAAVVEKGADGLLTMDRHHCTASGPARGGQLLGAALVVLAAPLGLRFLSSVVVNRATWVVVAQLATHFWLNVPRSELHSMGVLLEARQAALVVVSVDQSEQELARLIVRATEHIVWAG
jgi:hypothetical protein